MLVMAVDGVKSKGMSTAALLLACTVPGSFPHPVGIHMQ